MSKIQAEKDLRKIVRLLEQADKLMVGYGLDCYVMNGSVVIHDGRPHRSGGGADQEGIVANVITRANWDGGDW